MKLKTERETYYAIVNPCGSWLTYGNAGDAYYSLDGAERFDTRKDAERMLKTDGYDSACRVCKVTVVTKVQY